jgi:acyl carrier protein
MLDEQLKEAVAEVFGVAPEEVHPESSRETISEWDSVGHLRLILTVEDSYGFRFPTAEIPKLTSVGLIQQALERLRPPS